MLKNQSIIGLKDLRENTNSFIAKINRGESFVVVRRSKPVFKLVPVDEWGDTGHWETVADFTTIKKNGLSAKTILKRLKFLNGSNR